MTPDLMQLGTNEAISNALVEIAVGMGKSEEEIGAALGWALKWQLSHEEFPWVNMEKAHLKLKDLNKKTLFYGFDRV